MKSLVISTQNSLEKISSTCRSKGYGIEVLPFSDPGYLEKTPDGMDIHRKAFKRISSVTLHGPFSRLEPGSNDVKLRKTAEKEIMYSLKKAAELNAGHLIVHHGESGNTDTESWVRNSIHFWRGVLSRNRYSIQIHIENVRDKNPGVISKIVSGVEDKLFDICLDIGHAHCYSETPAEDWIMQLNRQIGYVHLHNNDGRSDGHAGFADGTLDIVKVCNALEKYSPDAIWAVEVRDEYIDGSIKWLFENGYI